MILVFWVCDGPGLAAVWPTRASSFILFRTLSIHPTNLGWLMQHTRGQPAGTPDEEDELPSSCQTWELLPASPISGRKTGLFRNTICYNMAISSVASVHDEGSQDVRVAYLTCILSCLQERHQDQCLERHFGSFRINLPIRFPPPSRKPPQRRSLLHRGHPNDH